MKKEDIKISIDNDVLLVSGNREENVLQKMPI